MTQTSTPWKLVKVRDVCKVVSGGTPSTREASYWDGNIPWITPMDLSKLNHKYIQYGSRSITNIGLKNSSAELIPRHSLIMSSRAPIGYFAINTQDATTSQGCKTFICSSEVEVEYLYYYLSYHISEIKKIGSGSTFAEVSKKHLEDLAIKIPTIAVQKEIVKMISAADDAIAATQKVIDQTGQLKKTLLQQLLTQGINHTKFKHTESGKLPEPWQIEKLGNISRFIDYRGKTPKKTPSGVPLITARNVRQGFISEEPREYIAEESFNEWMTRGMPLCGDIVFTTEAPLGHVAQIRTKEKLAFAQRVIVIQSKLNHNFLKYFLSSEIAQSNILSMATGGTVKGIKTSSLKTLPVFVPSEIEQKRISEILTCIDHTIAISKKLKAKQEQLKNGLMQDLLSGKVTV